MRVLGSCCSERFGRAESGCFRCWVQAGERSDEEAGGGRGDERVGGDDEGFVFGLGVDVGGAGAEDQAGDSAEDGEHGGFGEELGGDVGSGGAEGAA